MSAARRPPTRWGWHRLDDRAARLVVARSGVGPGDLVVDLGAGTGALTAALVEVGASVVALERHSGRREALTRRFADADVRVLDADVTTWPLPRRPFHVVANPPWSHAETLRARLLRAPALRRADLVLPRWLVHRWAGTTPRIGVGSSLRAEAFHPPAPCGAAVAVIAGASPARLTPRRGRGTRRAGRA